MTNVGRQRGFADLGKNRADIGRAGELQAPVAFGIDINNRRGEAMLILWCVN